MKFDEVGVVFDEISEVSSRLKITQLLADLFKDATSNEAATIAYLSLGNLNAVYVGTQFNLAEKSMINVVAKMLDVTPDTVKRNLKKEGDLGLVLQEGSWERKGEGLTVTQVKHDLQEIHDVSGTGSHAKKEKLTFDLLSNLDEVSAKYVVRIILGKLRLGFSDMTLIDSFSWMEEGDKSLRPALEDAYNVSADIGGIIKTLKEDSITAIEKMKITPGIPVRPAAAERMPDAKAIIKKLGDCIAQPKLDGFRLQVHCYKKGDTYIVRFFSRNLQEMSEMFPEFRDVAKTLKVKELVAEGEAIAYDEETDTFLPFQETVKRRRKHDIESLAKSVPLKLYFFDVLYLNGTSYLDKTHAQRRRALADILPKTKDDEGIIHLIEEKKVTTAKELEDYFNENISAGLEGLVVKKPDSIYQPGKRNFNWIKLKRQETGHLTDTLDCVILGYYAGHGKRAKFGIGAFLVGVLNKKEDVFQTVAKIGTGLTDKGWIELKEKCDAIEVKNKPRDVQCAKALVPDVWVSPDMVCAIRADEITRSPLHKAGATDKQNGYALRFPRMIEYRDDKSPADATTVKEVEDLFGMQYKGKKKAKK